MMLSMPSPSQRMSKFDNYERNSPFTEILLELASEDSNDQFFGGKTINAFWRSILLTLTRIPKFSYFLNIPSLRGIHGPKFLHYEKL
jgi:hypothetical protein